MARRSTASATSSGCRARPSCSLTSDRMAAAQRIKSVATGICTATSGATPRDLRPANTWTIRGRVRRQVSRCPDRVRCGTPRRSARSFRPPAGRTKPTCSGRAVASSTKWAHRVRCWRLFRGLERRRSGAREHPAAMPRMMDRGTRASGLLLVASRMASKRAAWAWNDTGVFIGKRYRR